MKIKKKLEKLKIGESLKIGSINILRVHGGWLYCKEKVFSRGYAIDNTFVPWPSCPEFKDHIAQVFVNEQI